MTRNEVTSYKKSFWNIELQSQLLAEMFINFKFLCEANLKSCPTL